MNKVKYYRLISGLLLKDLSEKTGLSVGHLSHIENGNKQPSKSAFPSPLGASYFQILKSENVISYIVDVSVPSRGILFPNLEHMTI